MRCHADSGSCNLIRITLLEINATDAEVKSPRECVPLKSSSLDRSEA